MRRNIPLDTAAAAAAASAAFALTLAPGVQWDPAWAPCEQAHGNLKKPQP
jgi:hypothetical protein